MHPSARAEFLASVEANPPTPSVSLTWNGVTELHWLTAHGLHVGVMAAITRDRNAGSSISECKKHRGRVLGAVKDAGGAPGGGASPQLPSLYRTLVGFSAKLERLIAGHYFANAVIADPPFVSSCFRFFRSQAVLLTRAITPGPTGAVLVLGVGGAPPPPILPPPAVSLPVRPPLPALATLPNYLATEVAAYLRWVAETQSRTTGLLSLPSDGMSDILTFLLLYSGSPVLVTSPYDRGALVSGLRAAYIPFPSDPFFEGGGGCPPHYNLVFSHPLALSCLTLVLARFHVDIAFTGGHSVFYDKFNYRNITADVFQYVWRSSDHRACLASAWAGNAPSREHDKYAFQQFATAVMNDTQFHVEESVKQLAEVKSVEKAQADAAGWAAMSAEDRNNALQKLSNAERQARSWLMHAQQQAHLMAAIAGLTPDVFLVTSVRARAAACLGMYLDDLVGSRSGSLKVKNMAQLGFNPRKLLFEICSILVQLAEHRGGGAAFVRDLVDDARSFHVSNYEAARYHLAQPQFLREYPAAAQVGDSLDRLLPAIRAAAASGKAVEVALGELPDEVCDKMMSSLLEAAVLLPTSRQVLSRATAEAWFLENANDPYSREPCAVSDLKELPQLDAAVRAWVAARTAGRDGVPELQAVRVLREAAEAMPEEGGKMEVG